MINLTRINGSEFVMNADLIRYVENVPDTLITLVDGDSVMVREPLDEVVRRAVSYQQAKNMLPRTGYRESEFGVRDAG